MLNQPEKFGDLQAFNHLITAERELAQALAHLNHARRTAQPPTNATLDYAAEDLETVIKTTREATEEIKRRVAIGR